MQLIKYVDNMREWIKPLFGQAAPETSTRRLAIQLAAHELLLLHINKIDGAIELLQSKALPYSEIDNIPLLLSAWVEQYDLATASAYWLLSPDDYQIILIESLAVPQNEIRDALHWRLQNLVNYPIEEAVIDFFMLPGKKISPDKNMIAAIVAKAAGLKKIMGLLQKSKINLKVIDIPELALRNLSALYETDEKSTAFLYFYEHTIMMNITRHQTLYFTRHINRPAADSTNNVFEQISLDIMRYFDYFQSQWRFPTPSRIFVAGANENMEEIASLLSAHLPSPAEPYAVNPSLNIRDKSMKLENKFLLPLGCVLRGEQHHAAPGN